MKQYFTGSVMALATFLIISCQEVIKLDLPNDDPQLVVEGYLNYWKASPERNNCTIKLSTTGNYYDKDVYNPVSDAIVEVMDESTRQMYPLSLIEDQPGVYFSKAIPMDIEKSYTLHIEHDGQEYQADGTLLPVAQVDSFSFRYRPESFFVKAGYYLYFSGSTPKQRGINYYRFTIAENDSLYNAPGDYLIQSDELLSRQVDTLQLANYAFNIGDTVNIHMYSLNKNIFDYYNELLELLFNDGGLFSAPPRNPTSNIHNLTTPRQPPLGFFQVSTVYGDTIVIEDEQNK